MPLSLGEPLRLLEPDMPPYAALEPYLRKVAASGRYSNFGPLALELEARLAERFFRGAHCVSTASGTSAIEIALQALALPRGSRVVVPAFGFAAAAVAVARLGHEPIFADVDPATWQLDPEALAQQALRANARAVLAVSSFGYPEPAQSWDRFSAATGIPVIIDAAAGLGNQELGESALVAFSLHATKPLGVGEGGLVACADRALAERIRSLANFGFAQGTVREIGGNAKLSEWHAALGHAQLDRWDEIRKRRAVLRDRYCDALPRDATLHPAAAKLPVTSFMPILLASPAAAEKLLQSLADERVEARRWFRPALPAHPAFRGPRTLDGARCANAERLADCIVCLPFHARLEPRALSRVGEVVAEALAACAAR